jgi:hypothetical protein
MKMMVDRILCGAHEPFSDGYYECYVREYITTVYHPVSTCAMGPKGSKDAVVDHRYKLYQVYITIPVNPRTLFLMVGLNPFDTLKTTHYETSHKKDSYNYYCFLLFFASYLNIYCSCSHFSRQKEEFILRIYFNAKRVRLLISRGEITLFSTHYSTK